jgi:t-SNARE complex subunit (syntaxin)
VDEEIDREIDNVLEGIKKWKEGLSMTGELIKETDDRIEKLTQQVDKVNEDLFRSNKQLKGIVEKFRKPHKFCIDVVLVLILIALVVGIVKLSS